jgi:hypothetical protein
MLAGTGCAKSGTNNANHSASLGEMAVTVIKKPPEVECKDLELNRRKGTRSGAANTRWFYHCYTKFDYKLEQKPAPAQATAVSIKITKVTMNIELSVVMWIPKGSPQKVLEHERGHARICTRIYEAAEKAARDAADSVVGMKYEGLGDTLDTACADAVNKAAEETCKQYRKNTTDMANQVSQIYDDLAAQGKAAATADQLIQAAFKRFSSGDKGGEGRQ